VGADNIARTAPFLESFATARGCATNLFKVIDLTSKIDPLSTDGKLLNYGLRGDVEFQDVFFRYPSRPEVIVHRGTRMRIKLFTSVMRQDIGWHDLANKQNFTQSMVE